MEQRRFTLYEYLLLVVLDLHVNSTKKLISFSTPQRNVNSNVMVTFYLSFIHIQMPRRARNAIVRVHIFSGCLSNKQPREQNKINHRDLLLGVVLQIGSTSRGSSGKTPKLLCTALFQTGSDKNQEDSNFICPCFEPLGPAFRQFCVIVSPN
jgi:hypothetical protein